MVFADVPLMVHLAPEYNKKHRPSAVESVCKPIKKDTIRFYRKMVYLRLIFHTTCTNLRNFEKSIKDIKNARPEWARAHVGQGPYGSRPKWAGAHIGQDPNGREPIFAMDQMDQGEYPIGPGSKWVKA